MGILQNNFTSGIVSPKLWGQYNSEVYNSGCARLDNFRILRQGGVSRRFPTKFISQAFGKRLIPFVINESLSFVIELGDEKLRVWKVSVNPSYEYTWEKLEWTMSQTDDKSILYNGHGLTFSSFDESVLSEVQYAQGLKESVVDSETVTSMILVMVHKGHFPIVIEYDSVSDEISLPYFLQHDNDTVKFSVDSDGNEYPDTLSFLSDTSNCPACVFYYASRLWFANTKSQPYRMWASRPFKTFSFEMVDYSEVVDDTTTSQDIIDAIESGSDAMQVVTTTISREVIREDNALLLEAGSAQNDEIKWLSSVGNNIIVGTSSAEWVMSGAINGLSQSAYQASAYGSAHVQPVMAGNDLIFTQSGAKKVRAYIGSDSGYSCVDLNFVCGDILDSQIKRMTFKRVSEPMMFSVLKDGTLAVLFYDRMYNIQGWGKWTLYGEVLDVMSLDTNEGQTTYVLVNNNGTSEIVSFDETSQVFMDNETHPFDSRLETCTYENSVNGSSIGKKKRIYSAKVRVLDTNKCKAGYYWGSSSAEYENEYTTTTDNPYGVDDFDMTLAGGYQKYVSFKLSSVGSYPLTVDAISLTVEVE